MWALGVGQQLAKLRKLARLLDLELAVAPQFGPLEPVPEAPPGSLHRFRMLA